ncbi:MULTISPECIES: hypothetical protein [Paenibacillus]|uniref:Uncharacterized protein n=1 Tax=Paenibacillus residui TaxID=629724 RepID=A0ABW3DFX6_9BACL|nr:hypothetical protein [Paenibacillus sp. 32O-W]
MTVESRLRSRYKSIAAPLQADRSAVAEPIASKLLQSRWQTQLLSKDEQ